MVLRPATPRHASPPSPTHPDGSKPKHAPQREESDDTSEQGRPRGNPDEQEDPNQVGWDGPDDPENPQNWSQKRKWALTLLCSFLTVNVTFASSAPSSASQQLAAEFDIGTTTATLITSIFLAGYCLGPIIWSTTSELVGRKLIFSISMLMYTLFILGQALAKNPQTLFITRFISGVCAAAPPHQRGRRDCRHVGPGRKRLCHEPLLVLRLHRPSDGTHCGRLHHAVLPRLAMGCFWIMLIFAGLCWIVTTLLLPETFAPILLVRKAKRLRKLDPEANKELYAPHEKSDWSFKGVMHRTLLRPFQILAQGAHPGPHHHLSLGGLRSFVRIVRGDSHHLVRAQRIQPRRVGPHLRGGRPWNDDRWRNQRVGTATVQAADAPSGTACRRPEERADWIHDCRTDPGDRRILARMDGQLPVGAVVRACAVADPDRNELHARLYLAAQLHCRLLHGLRRIGLGCQYHHPFCRRSSFPAVYEADVHRSRCQLGCLVARLCSVGAHAVPVHLLCVRSQDPPVEQVCTCARPQDPKAARGGGQAAQGQPQLDQPHESQRRHRGQEGCRRQERSRKDAAAVAAAN
ncbi:hypothetical protein L1887_63078 [Cichorium endivia]|nr:hypothetical protein L1887_63078 [Cichorium endivia]